MGSGCEEVNSVRRDLLQKGFPAAFASRGRQSSSEPLPENSLSLVTAFSGKRRRRRPPGQREMQVGTGELVTGLDGAGLGRRRGE